MCMLMPPYPTDRQPDRRHQSFNPESDPPSECRLLFMLLVLVCEEFEALPQDSEDPAWRKYLGDAAEKKMRALADLLKSINDHCDQQTSVDEFNVLLGDKKKLHAIYTVCNSWFRTGSGSADGFADTFTEMQKYLQMPPQKKVKLPVAMTKNHFEAFLCLLHCSLMVVAWDSSQTHASRLDASFQYEQNTASRFPASDV